METFVESKRSSFHVHAFAGGIIALWKRVLTLYLLLSDHQHSRHGASGASEFLQLLADVLMRVA